MEIVNTPVIINHLLDFEYMNSTIPVFHHKDAIYFGYESIIKTINYRVKRTSFATDAIQHIEYHIIADTPTGARSRMLGEASVKHLLRAYNINLYNHLVDTVIPYALRFIIRRDINVIRADLSQIHKSIARMAGHLSGTIIEAAEHAEKHCEHLGGKLVNDPNAK